jgi:hypothetical protein
MIDEGPSNPKQSAIRFPTAHARPPTGPKKKPGRDRNRIDRSYLRKPLYEHHDIKIYSDAMNQKSQQNNEDLGTCFSL